MTKADPSIVQTGILPNGNKYIIRAVEPVVLTTEEIKATIAWIHAQPNAPQPPASHIVELWHTMGDFFEEYAKKWGLVKRGYQLVEGDSAVMEGL